MNSFDNLVRDLRQAANMWFRKEDILKLEKLIEMARLTEDRRAMLVARDAPKMVLELRHEDGDHAAS